MTPRTTFALVIAASAIVVACSSGNGTGFAAQPCGGDAGSCPPEAGAGPSGSDGGASMGDAGVGSPSSAAGSCVSDVPCASESQCVAIGGSTCNQVLHRCQTVFCLADGQPCSNGGQCHGEICEPSGADANKGVCTNRQAKIAACAVDCAKKMRGAYLCAGHALGNIDAACAEICGPFLDDKSCSARVMNDGYCFDDGRCQILDGCGKDFASTSSCD